MIGRRLSHVPTLASLNVRYRKTFGHKFRDVIAACGSCIKPIRKYIFPNFLVVHYFYIVMITIIASILMYPVKNERYIDILFLATGASTQGGLNTVDTNSLSLYQQIVVYVTCIFSTPIAIHGCLAFVRLYWFERYFDGIRASSKKNYKMRRTKTILGRELTGRTMSRYPQRTHQTLSMLPTTATPNDDFQEKLFSGKMLYRDEGEPADGGRQGQATKTKEKHGVDFNGSSCSSSNTVKDNNTTFHSKGGLIFKEPASKEIGRPREGFVGRRRSTEISPEDMYRSIQMMQGQHQENAEDEGPALVIGAPLERPVSRSNGINEDMHPSHPHAPNTHRSSTKVVNEENIKKSTSNYSNLDSNESTKSNETSDKKSPASLTDSLRTNDEDRRNRKSATSEARHGPSIQFDVSAQPKRPSSRLSRGPSNILSPRSHSYKRKSSRGLLTRLPKGKGLRQKLKRRLSSNSIEGPSASKRTSYTDDDQLLDKDNMEEYFADNESDEDDEERGNQVPGHLYEHSQTLDESERPHSAVSNGMPKSFTIDARQAKELDQLAKSPEFQKMIYKDWKRKHRKQNPLRRKAWNNKSPDSDHASGFPWAQESQEGDENESPGLDPDHVNFLNNGDTESKKKGEIPESDEENESKRRDGNSQNAHDSADEEQGYYGLSIDPEFGANPRPPIARTMSTNYLSWQPTIGRNSTFMGLSKAQKEELGGVEYTSIKLLCRIIVIYYVGFLILSFVMLVPWILSKTRYKRIVRDNGVSPTWWGFFTAMSSFTDLGLTLTADSMISFNEAIYPLIVMMWFIIVGNTGFPVLLRFIIWILFKISPELSQTKENLGFLLDHPRRCFTLLFPSSATWWLLATLIGLNGTDLVLFIILDFGSPVLKPLSHGFRVLDGLFQGVSTRTAGFSVVNLSELHPAVQVSYMLMMYVSVLPLAISIRRTNVYEEQSLGLYGEFNREDSDDDTVHSDDSDGTTSTSNEQRSSKKKHKQPSTESFIGAHLRKQLSFDIWFLFLGLFIICLCEGGKIKDTNRPEFTVFSILFEIVSAYGTVGLSLGYPGVNTSFSGQFTTLSKLVIIAMLIRGRHRGLPYALDRAIMLPSDRLEHIDHLEDLKLKKMRRNQSNNVDPVTAYFKKRTGQLHKGLDYLKRSMTDPEEHLLESYEQHNRDSDYNLHGEAQDSDYPLGSSSRQYPDNHSTHSAPSSINSQPSIDSQAISNNDGNQSVQDTSDDYDEPESMNVTAPVSFRQ